MNRKQLLVLFDAENMPIQNCYREVEAIVSKKFSPTIWKNAQLVSAYKENTEGYSNRGYNRFIKSYYVGDGKDKADDKLVDIAKENSDMDMVIVSSDKELIRRVQDVFNRTVLVCNAQAIYSHLLDEVKKIRELKREVEKKRKSYFEQYTKADRIIESINKKISKKRKILKDIKQQNSYVKDTKEIEYSNIFKDTLLDGLQYKIEPTYAKTHPKLREVSLSIIDFFKDAPKIELKLKGDGLDLSVVKQAIEYAVIDFSKSYFGFDRFIDFVRFFVKDTSLKLVFKEPSQYKIIFKEHNIDGFVEVEFFDDNEIVETVESISELLLEKKSPSSLDINFLESLKRKL